MYDVEGGQFTEDAGGIIIAVGGPGVNYAWYHYNPLFESGESSLYAWFAIRQGGTVVVRTRTGRTYRANRTHTYAIVQLYTDWVSWRRLLLVAGLTGKATRAACMWLAEQVRSGPVVVEGAAAVVLAVNKTDIRDVEVVERVYP